MWRAQDLHKTRVICYKLGNFVYSKPESLCNNQYMAGALVTIE